MHFYSFKVLPALMPNFFFSGIMLHHLGKDCGQWSRFKGIVHVLPHKIHDILKDLHLPLSMVVYNYCCAI